MEGSSRQRKIELAASFLAHPAVQSSDWEKQKRFLRAKGLDEQEIDQAHFSYLTGKSSTWPLKPLAVNADDALLVGLALPSVSMPARPQGVVCKGEPLAEKVSDLEDDMPLSCLPPAAAPKASQTPTKARPTDAAESDSSSSDSDSSSSSTSSDSDDVPLTTLVNTAATTPARQGQARPAPKAKAKVLVKAQQSKPTEPERVESSSSSSSSSSSTPLARAQNSATAAASGSVKTTARQVAVRYRSDAALWPREAATSALTREQRAKLTRLAVQFSKPLQDCLEDLQDLQKKISEFRRDCPSKQELVKTHAELEAEAEKYRSRWSDAVNKLIATWQLSTPVDMSPAQGVRPQIVRGKRWYIACLESPGMKRVLGPLRPTAEEASRDYSVMSGHLKDKPATKAEEALQAKVAAEAEVGESADVASSKKSLAIARSGQAQEATKTGEGETQPPKRRRLRLMANEPK